MSLPTKDKALCIYHMLEPPPDNIAISRERFDRELGSQYEFCYMSDQRVPVTALRSRVYGSPQYFTPYLEVRHEFESTPQPTMPILGDSTVALSRFIDQCYLPKNAFYELDQGAYEYQESVSYDDMFKSIKPISSATETISAFRSYVGKGNFIFKKSKSPSSSKYDLCVLKQEYHGKMKACCWFFYWIFSQCICEREQGHHRIYPQKYRGKCKRGETT